MTYAISNKTCGLFLGVYEGDAEQALAVDAGYESPAEMDRDEALTAFILVLDAVAEIARIARKELVLCESPDGYSLHYAGSTDEDIASGNAPPLVSGAGGPTKADYARAWLKAHAARTIH